MKRLTTDEVAEMIYHRDKGQLRNIVEALCIELDIERAGEVCEWVINKEDQGLKK